uniref:GNAT family N-acetyltransferase n=1 Tax=Candidatus Methanomethylicus mesodigestus TaxID=1867258 RepID=A0A7C3ERP9_9CREN
MITVRHLAPADVPSVVGIINAQYDGSYEEVPFTAGSFSKYVMGRKTIVLVAEDNGRIVGAIVYVVWPWGNCIDMLAAIQTAENQEIEDLLVRELEQSVRAGSIYTNVEEGSPQIRRWELRGYYLEGGVYHLTVPLSGKREVPQPRCGAALRSLRRGEEGALVELINRSFGFKRLDMEEVRSWWEVPGFSEEWIQVAELDERLVSATVCMLDNEYFEHFGRKRGYLGPAATLPEYRKMGLTSALTVKAMNFLAQQGMESAAMYVIDGNSESLGLAHKLGFRVAKHWVHMNKDLAGSRPDFS